MASTCYWCFYFDIEQLYKMTKLQFQIIAAISVALPDLTSAWINFERLTRRAF